MIQRFSTLYVGHIELERCGLDGVPADERRYANGRLVETFETAAALARATDELGFDTLWLAEHHFQHEGYECIPNIPLLAVDLAHRTKRVKIGCAFNIVPTWHPLRLAEDYATADILTKGRVVFGVGRGYHSREVETFGNPMLDAEANRALFEEQVEIILKAFREESFAHAGKHYTLPPPVPYRGYPLEKLTLVPRPLRQPVEVWQPIVSGSARSLDFMARHGIKGVISATAEQFVEQWARDYQAAAGRHGRALALGEDLILGYRMALDDTVAGAVKRARPYFEEHAKFMAPLGMLRYSEEHVKAVAARQAQSPRGASLEHGIKNRSWLCGPPGDIVAYLKEVEARFPGLEHVMIAWALGTPRDEMIAQLTRFANDVMPAFRR
ncbi:MAG: LLM class flavin-dependent oxidoreductase [Candidatus Rokubacteria bacterium]|nr:LLM class flavin-dependent oxidoreductase [Candidatus Rokubacteria bacterium]